MSGEIRAVDSKRDDLPGPPRVVPSHIKDLEDSPAELFWTLFQARILISAVTVGFVAAGALYIAFATPQYRTDVVVQVEETTKSVGGLSEISPLFSDKSLSDTEMQILRSRTLLGNVVDQLNLQIVAAPKRFPLLGALARRYRGSTPARPVLGLGSYAWGGERIRVHRLEVPEALLNRPFTLVAGEGGRYELRGSEGERILTGEIGKAARGDAPEGRVEMYVSDLLARPGTRFVVSKHGRLGVIEELQEKLNILEKGKRTGVMTVELDGPDPSASAAILDAIASMYVRQNVERKSAEAAKTLEFLETQLPTLKANLDVSEAALKGYQVQKGTLDLSREGEAMLNRSVEIETTLSDAELQRTDLRQRFTDSHPALISLANKIEKLRGDRNAMNAKMRDLPGTELDSTRLTRDVKVASELYNILLNKAQELRVVKSGTIGNVRVIDRAAIPTTPVRPVIPLVLGISLGLGLLAGVAAAFTRKSLYAGLDDPETVERITGMTVYATVPRSAKLAALSRGVDRRRSHPLLGAIDPGDPAVEAMRSLRTGLQFALLEAKNNVICITGPTAGVGKSFVAVNLAHVLANAGRRVLIIDGDLRRGCLHKFFGGSRAPGLCDMLTETALVGDAVQKSGLETLHWLPTGLIPPNPAELVGSDRFERVLKDLSARYDLVIVDTPPVMPVTDAALIGQFAATTLLVLRAGAHPVREVLTSVKRLAQNGVHVQGAVFNDVSGAGARYSKYGYHYRYDSNV